MLKIKEKIFCHERLRKINVVHRFLGRITRESRVSESSDFNGLFCATIADYSVRQSSLKRYFFDTTLYILQLRKKVMQPNLHIAATGQTALGSPFKVFIPVGRSEVKYTVK